MATTVMEPSQTNTNDAPSAPDVTEAFIADRQAFWSSFTNFVFMGASAIVVLLIVLAFFLG